MPRPRTVSDEAILEAATRVISRIGPATLTLAAVAVEAGLSPATLVQRFGSKRALLLALREGGAERVRAQLRARDNEHVSILETLIRNLQRLALPVADPVAFSNQLAMLHQDLSDPLFLCQTQAYARAMHTEIVRLLEQAADARELKDWVDTEQIARSLETAYNGALITWAIERAGPLEVWLRRELRAVLKPWRASL